MMLQENDNLSSSDVTLKSKIEALLFLTGRALSIREISDLLKQPSPDIETALLDLMQDYAFRPEGALEIDDTEGYILQVKDSLIDVVNLMVPIELPAAVLRSLSVIALQGPIRQSDLVELRGANAYDHVKQLMAQKLIWRKKKDKAYLLGVTPKFHEYFKLNGDKNELKDRVLQEKLTEETPENLEPVL